MKGLTKINRLIFLMMLVFGFTTFVDAQCPITASITKFCRRSTVKFTIPASASYNTDIWDFGDGASASNTSTAFHLYDTFGVFKVKVTLKDGSSAIICTDSITLTIYDNPNANMMLPSTDIECFRGNIFCFNSLSTPGKFTHAPIIRTVWDFGDGDSSTSTNPCHNYKTSGSYKIILQIKDTNNCTAVDTIQKAASIVVLPDLNPQFTTTFKLSCPTTTVTFNNKTDTIGKCITKFWWDFGDGNWDSSMKNWTGFTHVYIKDGSFTPYLYVQSCLGCRDSLRLPSGARNIFYYFDISRNPGDSAVCWGGNSICFSQTPRKLAYYWLWTFNDPNCPPNENTNDKSWGACHSYAAPGVYAITLKIWEPNCIRDTTMCLFTPLKGPMAMIQLPPPPAFPDNTCMRNKPVSIYDFAWIDGKCNYPLDPATGLKVTQIKFDTMAKVKKYVIDSGAYFCNSPIVSQDTVFQPSLCPGYPPSITRINYHINPATIKYEKIYDSFKLGPVLTWTRGTALPLNAKKKQLYYAPSGYPCFDATMNENEIYKYNCQGPNLVRYTNNSQKYRLRYDIDNDPTEYAGDYPNSPWGAPSALKEFDRCFNKSYPWASDSMQYLWNFGDSYGKNCTSTTSKPDLLCMYSTEIQPTHLFQKTGCFTSTLTVWDTVTNCFDKATVQIIMEPPRASWDPKVIDTLAKKMYYYTVADTITKSPLKIVFIKDSFRISRIDWNMRNNYSTLLPPSIGQRGLYVIGAPCVCSLAPYWQTLDMSETQPTCGRQTFWVLFDSASDCSAKCTDKVLMDLDSNGKLDTFPITIANCNWIDKTTWDMMGDQYCYSTPGCKTVGFIIQTGDCLDTFFYHNYKYIQDLNGCYDLFDPNSFDVTKGIYTKVINFDNGGNYQLCPPFQAIVAPCDHSQQNIIKFTWTISKYFGSPSSKPVYLYDSCRHIKDTVYYLCEKDSFTLNAPGDTNWTDCVTVPDLSGVNCYEPLNGSVPLSAYLKNHFVIKKVYHTLKLDDTISLHDTVTGNSMWQPGKYTVSSYIQNIYGCFSPGGSGSQQLTDVFVGVYTEFNADNQIICYKNGNDTVRFTSFVRYFTPKLTPISPDLDSTPYWLDPIGQRGGRVPVAPSVPEKIQWVFDGDGIFETPGKIGTDTVMHLYTKPGDYTVRMKTTDSNNCMQILEKTAYIKVIGVIANFDTLGGVSVCAPQTVKFVDKSLALNVWRYTYDATGKKTDSVKVDSIIYWSWNFGDNLGTRSVSYLQNPIHTYTKNGTYNVTLIVKMRTGCTDTIVKSAYVSINGPKPYIRQIGLNTGCQPFVYTVKDSSRDVSLWEFVKGDGKSASFKALPNPSDSTFQLTYDSAGTFYLYLIATDSVWNQSVNAWTQCITTFGDTNNPDDPHFKVVVWPDNLSAMTPVDTTICSTSQVSFVPNSDTTFKQVFWDFGDSNSVDPRRMVTLPRSQDAKHIYVLAKNSFDSTYHVVMFAQGAKCPDGTKTGVVRVLKTVANFDTIHKAGDSKWSFRNNTKLDKLGATNYKWTVDGISMDTNQNIHISNEDTTSIFTHDFGNTKGRFKVCLETWTDVKGLGCNDSMCKIVTNEFDTALMMPNVFFPDWNDGKNDKFYPRKVLNVSDWDLAVFNRWGEKVYHSSNINEYWDGTIRDRGNRLAPDGTYYWVLKFKFRGDNRQKLMTGTVNVVRGAKPN